MSTPYHYTEDGVPLGMQLGFATDIHLDHVKDAKGYVKHERVGRKLAENVDVLVLGGDLSVGPSLQSHLAAFIQGAGIPVYYVLGNHDFWKFPENEVKKAATALGGFLDALGVVELSPSTALIGCSGWYDTRAGNPYTSRIRVNDWRFCERLIGAHLSGLSQLLVEECRKWADEETARAALLLEAAAVKYRKVFFVTHFPPWEETSWSEAAGGNTSSPDWLPWTVNTGMGRTIADVAERHPHTDFQVMTGHTHCRGSLQLLPNLKVFSGGARYGSPSLANFWEVPR